MDYKLLKTSLLGELNTPVGLYCKETNKHKDREKKRGKLTTTRLNCPRIDIF